MKTIILLNREDIKKSSQHKTFSQLGLDDFITMSRTYSKRYITEFDLVIYSGKSEGKKCACSGGCTCSCSKLLLSRYTKLHLPVDRVYESYLYSDIMGVSPQEYLLSVGVIADINEFKADIE
jgi:hypothetical protein